AAATVRMRPSVLPMTDNPHLRDVRGIHLAHRYPTIADERPSLASKDGARLEPGNLDHAHVAGPRVAAPHIEICKGSLKIGEQPTLSGNHCPRVIICRVGAAPFSHRIGMTAKNSPIAWQRGAVVH